VIDLTDRKKKALSITINIPGNLEKEEKALDQPPELDKEKEERALKKQMLSGHEQDLARKKKDGTPLSLDEKAMMGMIDG
jgi:hypothetical protein